MKVVLTNKELAKRAQEYLKNLGVNVKLGHIYELLARKNGFNSWNMASASDVILADAFKDYEEFELFLDLMSEYDIPF